MVNGDGLTDRLTRGAVAAAAWLGLLFIVLPLGLVVWLSFVSNEILALPPDGYSFRWYHAMLGQPQFASGFTTSLIVAVLATAIGLLVSIPAALVLARGRFLGRNAIVQLLTAPLIVPAIVVGAGLYVSFVEAEIVTGWELTGSAATLAAGHVLLTIPWCLRLLLANLAGLDPAAEEAAMSLGARPVTATRLVTLPLIWPGVVAAALFSFVVSFSNLEISMFLVTPGNTTLPIAIFQYLQWKVDPTIAAVSTVQIAVVGLGLLLTNRFVPLGRVL